MLSTEYNSKLARARELFRERGYADMVRIVHAMDWHECHNLDLLWMMAVESYIPAKGPVNIISEVQLHALFHRLKVDSKLPVVVTPPPPVVVDTFTAELWYGDSDPYSALVNLAQEPGTYQLSVQRPVGAFIPFPTASIPIDQYLVIRYPDTESVKTAWTHDLFNNGDIPDTLFHSVHTAGGYRYIVSRVRVTLNPTQPINFV